MGIVLKSFVAVGCYKWLFEVGHQSSVHRLMFCHPSCNSQLTLSFYGGCFHLSIQFPFSWNITFLYVLFCSSLNLFKLFPVFCTLFFYTALLAQDVFLQNFWWYFPPVTHTSQRYCKCTLLFNGILFSYTLAHLLSVTHNTCLSHHLMFQHWQGRTPCGLASLNKPVSYLPVLGEEISGTLCT
jgi:hypothetical protein